MKPHEALLTRWSEQPHHKDKGFIHDGVIDPERWRCAPRKVLLLLKEAYGEPGMTDGFDLRQLIRDDWKGPKYKIWWTAAYWCYAAHYAMPLVPEFPTHDAAYDAARYSLLSSAAINIKKSDGRPSSDNDEIADIAKRDGDLLRDQVEIIDPEIVICGNTWKFVRHLWPDAVAAYGRVWRTASRIFVDFWHPANHFPNEMNYYALACLLQNGITLPITAEPKG